MNVDFLSRFFGRRDGVGFQLAQFAYKVAGASAVDFFGGIEGNRSVRREGKTLSIVETGTVLFLWGFRRLGLNKGLGLSVFLNNLCVYGCYQYYEVNEYCIYEHISNKLFIPNFDIKLIKN